MSDNPADSIRRELEAGRTLDDPLTRLIADTLAHRVSEDWHRVEDMNTREMMLMVILDAVAVREVVEAALEAARTDERERLRGLTRCICGPDSTGEAPNLRPDCPQHGVDAGTNRWPTEAPF